jgi:catalase
MRGMGNSDLAKETIAPGEEALVSEFVEFMKAASGRKARDGQPVRRFNQGRHSACVEAEFTVPEGLPDAHRVGLFAEPRTWKAWIRFANASSDTDRERDIRGMSIKVLDVGGQNLTAGATSHDFVLNSHPVMPAADPKEFLPFLRAVDAGGIRQAFYFISHAKARRIVLAARQQPASHLDVAYWSATPYLFGEGRAVKYSVRPTSPTGRKAPDKPTETYLRDALAAHLAASDAAFDFAVQFQTDPQAMPIEDASVEWPERDSPYRTVARIRIPRQRIDEAGRDDRCEQVSFNPWSCRPEHRPLGSMNRARREIYRAMSEFRAGRT